MEDKPRKYRKPGPIFEQGKKALTRGSGKKVGAGMGIGAGKAVGAGRGRKKKCCRKKKRMETVEEEDY